MSVECSRDKHLGILHGQEQLYGRKEKGRVHPGCPAPGPHWVVVLQEGAATQRLGFQTGHLEVEDNTWPIYSFSWDILP